MNLNGRLKLCPKKKEGVGFHRIHKLHNDTSTKESNLEHKGLCLVSKSNNL